MHVICTLFAHFLTHNTLKWIISVQKKIKRKSYKSFKIAYYSLFLGVGMTGLEPATTRPPDVYANQLRYIPCFLKASAKVMTYCDITKFMFNFLYGMNLFSIFA